MKNKMLNIDRIKVSAFKKLLSHAYENNACSGINVNRHVLDDIMENMDIRLGWNEDRVYLDEDQISQIVVMIETWHCSAARHMSPGESSAINRCHMQLTTTRKEYAERLNKIHERDMMQYGDRTCSKEWFLGTIGDGPHPELLKQLKKKLGQVKDDRPLSVFLEAAHDFLRSHKQYRAYLSVCDFTVACMETGQEKDIMETGQEKDTDADSWICYLNALRHGAV